MLSKLIELKKKLAQPFKIENYTFLKMNAFVVGNIAIKYMTVSDNIRDINMFKIFGIDIDILMFSKYYYDCYVNIWKSRNIDISMPYCGSINWYQRSYHSAKAIWSYKEHDRSLETDVYLDEISMLNLEVLIINNRVERFNMIPLSIVLLSNLEILDMTDHDVRDVSILAVNKKLVRAHFTGNNIKNIPIGLIGLIIY